MDREWNWPIALTLLGGALVAGFNLWFWTAYHPLNPFWELFAITSSFFVVIVPPILVYYGARTAKRWPGVLVVGVLLACLSSGIVLARNGRNDVSPVVFYPGTVIGREIGKTKSGAPLYRFQIKLNEPPHYQLTIGTGREQYEALANGTPVEVPARSGNLKIPWRVYGEPVRYPGQQ